MDNTAIRSSLEDSLGSLPEPVAITFVDTPPSGVEKVTSPAPAGCAYWKLAASGQHFYTAADDHLNCPIGAYTHGIELTPKTEQELQGLVQTMVNLRYLRMEEVPTIPRVQRQVRFVVYAPLSKLQATADVVLFHGNARQMMLLVEAANAKQVMSTMPVLGRPACAVIAATMQSGKASASLGCIGNRVYTELPDEDLYVAIPGNALDATLDGLHEIAAANRELEQFHRGRCACA